VRIPLNESPLRYKVDYAAAGFAGLPEGEYLITLTEFGVSLAWRQQSHATWSPPIAAVDVTQ
jgi:hypothetical protein